MKELLIALSLMVAACNQASKTATADTLTPGEANDLAKESWLLGMPLVMFEKQIDYSTHVTQPGKTRASINRKSLK